MGFLDNALLSIHCDRLRSIVKMTLLSKLFGCLNFFLPRHHLSRQCSDGNLGCSSIQEEPIQRPPEDTEMEEEMDYEDCLVELKILPDFSRAPEPLMIPVEEPESQTPHAGVKIFLRSCTVAKPLLIQVAPQHPLPDEVETWTSFSTVAEPLMAEKETPPDEVNKSPCSSTKGAETLMVQEAHAEEEILPFFSTVAGPLMAQFEEPEKELPSSFTEVAEPLMVQEAPWHLSPPSEEEISFSTVAEPLMDQMAPAEVEQEHPPQRRGRRRRKKERQTYSSTIKLPGATPPAKPKHAWMDVSPAQDTKAEEKTIKKEREVEDKTPVVKMPSVEIVEVDLRQERRMKKERKTEYTPPPAKAKLAWTEMDGGRAKVTHTKKREDEKRRRERQAKIEDRKTEQAADITPPPAKGKKTHVQEEPESSSKISQKSSRKQNGLLVIYKLAEKKVTAEREKKIRKEEKIQRQLLYERYVNDPSMKHLLINKHNRFSKSYGCVLPLII